MSKKVITGYTRNINPSTSIGDIMFIFNQRIKQHDTIKITVVPINSSHNQHCQPAVCKTM